SVRRSCRPPRRTPASRAEGPLSRWSQTLQSQQTLLHTQAAGKAAQRSIAGDHTVARYQERHRVGAARCADGARRFGLADLARHPAVGPHPTIRNALEHFPDLQAKSRLALQIKRQVKAPDLALQISNDGRPRGASMARSHVRLSW